MPGAARPRHLKRFGRGESLICPVRLERLRVSQQPDNLRIEGRKSLFVQATLHFADGLCSTKVRNISPVGALIEAERLPRSGTPVELRRGSLVALGTIVWKRGGKAGVEFVAETDVSRWMPMLHGKDLDKKALQVFKRPSASAFANPLPSARVTTQDIEAVAQMLEDLAITFGKDAGVTHNYAPKLQGLDIAAQLLRKLASQARVRTA